MSSLDLIQVVVPVAIVGGAAFCSAVVLLGSTLVELRVLNADRALQACRRVAMLNLFLSVSSAVALAGQVFLALGARDTDSAWQHAFWNDAFASATFLVLTCILMYLSMEDFVGKEIEIHSVPARDLRPGEFDRLRQVDQGNNEEEQEEDDEEEEEAVLYTGDPTA